MYRSRLFNAIEYCIDTVNFDSILTSSKAVPTNNRRIFTVTQ